jgi:hypothetical protein
MRNLVLLIMALLTFLRLPIAFAQTSVQITNGANSPNISGTHGSVIVNYGDHQEAVAIQGLANATRRLAEQGDPVSNKLRLLIEQGDFGAARSAVASAIQKSNAQIAQVALLKYVDGVLWMLDRRPVAAERSMRAANALLPENCEYMAYEGVLLTQLDRMSEATLLMQDSKPEVSSCLRNAKPYDRLLLLMVTANLASEHRNEEEARATLQEADLVASQLALDDSENQLDMRVSVVCELDVYAKILLGNPYDDIDLTRSNDACKSLSARMGSSGAALATISSASARIPGKKDPGADFKIYSDVLAAVNSMQPVPNMGLTSYMLKLKKAETLSNRGFLRLWGMKDSRGAHDDYVLAYQTLQPLLVAQKPETWSVYRFLGGRLGHFNQLFPDMPVPGGTSDNIRRDLNILIKGPPIEDTMDMCELYFFLDGVGRQAASASDTVLTDAIEARHARCLSNMADQTTLRFKAEQYRSLLLEADHDVAKNDLALADETLGKALSIARQLYGFPRYFEKDFDLWERINQHAAIQRSLNKPAGSERDFREVIELSKNEGYDTEQSKDLMYLATLLVQTDTNRINEAQSAADEASTIRHTKLLTNPQVSCDSVVLYAGAQRLATEIAIIRDDYPALHSHLAEFADALQYVAECTDVAPEYVVIDGKQFDNNKLAPTVVIVDAILAKKALSDGSYTSVRAAVADRRESLEAAMKPYGDQGTSKDGFPILARLLRVAESGPPAH